MAEPGSLEDVPASGSERFGAAGLGARFEMLNANERFQLSNSGVWVFASELQGFRNTPALTRQPKSKRMSMLVLTKLMLLALQVA